MSPSQSIVALLVLSAWAFASPMPAVVVKTNAAAQAGVTAAICDRLNVKVLGAKIVQDACVAAGLAVGAKVSAIAVSPTFPSDVYATAFVGTLNTATSVSGLLYSILSNVDAAATTTFNNLSADVIIPTLTHVSADLNSIVARVGEVKRCTEVQVEASLYQGFVTLATALQSVFLRISSLPALYAREEVRASVHDSLLQAQAALHVFVDQLFQFISADLDKINLRAALFLSLDAAIKATA
ncbi:hypothetical protein PtB15_15B430 [Puccinia triticina]|nr:hypothetical protein PtB15_15B430 [Puccinia triticina]